jgi:hypothetical protein
MSIRGSFPGGGGGKRRGREPDPSPPTRGVVNEWVDFYRPTPAPPGCVGGGGGGGGGPPKRLGREADHSPPSSVEVNECVEIYLHSPNTPSSRDAQLKTAQGQIYLCPRAGLDITNSWYTWNASVLGKTFRSGYS